MRGNHRSEQVNKEEEKREQHERKVGKKAGK